MMFASSHADKVKAGQVSESVRRALEDGRVAGMIAGILGGTVHKPGPGNTSVRLPKKDPAAQPVQFAELTAPLKILTAELQADIEAGKLAITMEPRGLVISLREAAFFPSGQDTVAPETYGSIGKIAAAILKMENPVRVEGHTDSQPIHNARFRNNWDLSSARAIAMLELLTIRFHLPERRLAVIGYAATVPVDSNETETGRAHNRRVDLVILNQAGAAPEPRGSL